MEDSVWKFACLRDLQVPDPGNVPFKWIKLYAAAFVRNWGLRFDSHDALLTESLIESIKVPKLEETAEKLLPKEGYCLINNIRTGIWIAGTTQTLDARHIGLFLSEEYRSRCWDYYLLGSHNINKQVDGASGGISDFKHLNDEPTSGIISS